MGQPNESKTEEKLQAWKSNDGHGSERGGSAGWLA
jgi:hypothetical protein